MASKQNIGFVVGAALLAFSSQASASTITVNAESELFANGSSLGLESASDPLYASSAKSNSDSHAAARADAFGNIAVNASVGSTGAAAMMMMALPAPAGEASAVAYASWDNTITNQTGTQIGYKWAFRVENPRLGNGGHADDYAALAINVLVNGVAVWEAFASLDNCVLTTSNMSLTQWDPCAASGPAFDVVADLGVFAHGASFDVTYEMIGYADSGNTESEEYWGTYAGIGDPFDISGECANCGIIATPVVTGVPAPGSLGLLGAALLGVGFMRRKQEG